jgi:hypothetical protein
MNSFSKINRLFPFFILCLGTAQLWAGPADWSFLPASTVFKPLIGDPREPLTGIVAYLNQVNYEGQIGDTLELVRYSPQDDTQYGWGLFALGDILLGEDGATFPMLDGDFYIGTYFSGSFGDFSVRLEALHESTHLGDSYQTTVNGTLQSSQIPLYFSNGGPVTATYTRENGNATLSFQPSEFLRVYGGAGIWDEPLINNNSDPIFASFGAEIYSPYWSIDHSAMRSYLTGSLQWKGDQSVWDLEVQLGLQWKAFKSSDRALRIAILFYTGDSQFGQFYNLPDTHLALATFFDF